MSSNMFSSLFTWLDDHQSSKPTELLIMSYFNSYVHINMNFEAF